MSRLAASDGGPPFRPEDLVATGLVGVLVLFEPVVGSGRVGQAAVGLVAVLFAPGYALVGVLFPRQGPEEEEGFDYGWFDETQGSSGGTLTPVERLVLAVGLSVCVLPLLLLGLNFTPEPISQTNVLRLVGGTTVLLALVAAGRRWRVPASERFSPSEFLASARAAGAAWSGTGSRTLPQVLLAGAVVLSVAGIGVAVMHPTQGQPEQFTELSVLQTAPDSDGDTDGEYPTDPSETPLHVEIANREGERTTYVVVSKLQRVEATDGGYSVVAETELERFQVTVGAGETRRINHGFEPGTAGDRRRVVYLLYEGEAPPDPAVENAYRSVHVWLDDDS
jgi:uncharacterized membrane protein